MLPPVSVQGWSGEQVLSILSLLDAAWPGPLRLSDDQHSPVFVQTPDEYIYACSLRDAPDEDISGQAGIIL